MRDYVQRISGPESKKTPSFINQKLDERVPEYIDARLQGMMAEFQKKVRSCDQLFENMMYKTQVVSALLCTLTWPSKDRLTKSQDDAEWNLRIATSMKVDSQRMAQIALLGMIFLPGTFLAVSFVQPPFGLKT